ncbi:hypothetical protein [Sorangium sp. So ce1097]|uniref:hypothetical protein n=1 Tax=Sorangium sp. So ce1097 TaxID=3133330 RepID=UPI003F63CB9B
MAGALLTNASRLMCPHGGQVVIVSAGKALAGAPVGTVASHADTFSIVGCTFTLPGPKPSPCVAIEWMTYEQRLKVGSGFALSEGSVGICKADTGAPQGKVIVAMTQPEVAAQ